jgi:hypothetical protein
MRTHRSRRQNQNLEKEVKKKQICLIYKQQILAFVMQHDILSQSFGQLNELYFPVQPRQWLIGYWYMLKPEKTGFFLTPIFQYSPTVLPNKKIEILGYVIKPSRPSQIRKNGL